jgi:CheY-like chemotaxis protein
MLKQRPIAPHTAILVADDDPDVLCLMAAVLGMERPVIEAHNGTEAIEQASNYKPILIVCDSEMPGMRGAEVIAALAMNPELATVPVILTSGYPPGQVLEGIAIKPAVFLQKPFTLPELKRVVTETLTKAANEPSSGSA